MNSQDDADCSQLYLRILESDKLNFEEKKVMLNEARKLMPPGQNRWNLRWIIIPLGLVVVSVPLYAFSRAGEVPEALLSLASTALGALAAFLTNYRPKTNETVPSALTLPVSPPSAAVASDPKV